MNHQTTFKVIVALQLIIVFVFVCVDFYLVDSLPDLLREYLTWEGNQDLTTFDSIVLIILIPMLLIYVVSAVGLLLLKAWAKKPYVYVSILMIAITPFIGPTVEHAMTSTLGTIESVLLGLTIGLLYFCNVLEPQEKHV